MDAAIIAAIIGAVATILAVLVSGLLNRKKGGSVQKDESKSPQAVAPKTEIEAKKFVRRYLDYPSNYRFMWALPKMKAVVLENAQQGWDTGVTSDMRDASYDVIDFLEYSWLRLAVFYPDDHWGGKDAKAYIRDYIQ